MSALPTDPLKSIEIIAEDGVTYPLMGGNPCRFIALDGVGAAPVRRILQRTETMDGALDVSFRLEPRRMTLSLYIAADQQAEADARREKLAYIFGASGHPSPVGQESGMVTLKATRWDGAVRQIDCFLDGEFDYRIYPEKGAAEKVVVPLLAPDPLFYDPTELNSSGALSNGVTTDIDFSFTGLNKNTWDSYPIIELTGPLSTCQLQHVPGDELIRLSSAIPGGETFVIDLRPGQYPKVYRQSDSANRVSYINSADLGSFSLMRAVGEKTGRALNPSWVAPGSFYNNRFGFSNITGATGASLARVRFYRNYLSL